MRDASFPINIPDCIVSVDRFISHTLFHCNSNSMKVSFEAPPFLANISLVKIGMVVNYDEKVFSDKILCCTCHFGSARCGAGNANIRWMLCWRLYFHTQHWTSAGKLQGQRQKKRHLNTLTKHTQKQQENLQEKLPKYLSRHLTIFCSNKQGLTAWILDWDLIKKDKFRHITWLGTGSVPIHTLSKSAKKLQH